MRHAVRWMLVVGTILLTSPFLAVQAAEKDGLVTNPLYKYWADCKVGW